MNLADEPIRKQFLRKCKKSSHCLDAQDAFLKTLTVKYLINIQTIPNRVFARGERRGTLVATSYHAKKYLGLGIFVTGKVRKDEFLLIYRGETKIFAPLSDDSQNVQPRPRMGCSRPIMLGILVKTMWN